MKKIALLIVTIICTLPVFSQQVKYTYKALAAEGCTMRYSVAKQQNNYYIIASVSSDRMIFLNESTMKIRTFTDELLELQGVVMGPETYSTTGVIAGNIIVPVKGIKSTAQFSITPEQFEILKHGVSKILLTMTPMNHVRSFKKDKIGKKLYKFYQQVKEEDENF